MVNDCNYYVRFALYLRGEEDCALRCEDEVEPNSKLFLEELDRDALGAVGLWAMQAMVYKRGKGYAQKPVYDVPLHVEARKFYRQNAFTANDFFGQPALLVPVVRDDHPVRAFTVDAARLQAIANAWRESAAVDRIIAADAPATPKVHVHTA